jgi:hypothetical protein
MDGQVIANRDAFRHHLQTHLNDADVAAMESPNLLALRSKRAEIAECLCLLEFRPAARGGLAFTRLIERCSEPAVERRHRLVGGVPKGILSD